MIEENIVSFIRDVNVIIITRVIMIPASWFQDFVSPPFLIHVRAFCSTSTHYMRNWEHAHVDTICYLSISGKTVEHGQEAGVQSTAHLNNSSEFRHIHFDRSERKRAWYPHFILHPHRSSTFQRKCQQRTSSEFAEKSPRNKMLKGISLQYTSLSAIKWTLARMS